MKSNRKSTGPVGACSDCRHYGGPNNGFVCLHKKAVCGEADKGKSTVFFMRHGICLGVTGKYFEPINSRTSSKKSKGGWSKIKR